jgi:hypothetical protein
MQQIKMVTHWFMRFRLVRGPIDSKHKFLQLESVADGISLFVQNCAAGNGFAM